MGLRRGGRGMRRGMGNDEDDAHDLLQNELVEVHDDYTLLNIS